MNINDIEKGFQGLSINFGKFLAEAGALCLENEGHNTGVIAKLITDEIKDEQINWTNKITQQIKLSWNDENEAIEYGATSIALLTTYKLTGFSVLARSIKGTGFDYWVGNSDDELPFNKKARLEISGIKKGKLSDVNARIKIKKKQTDKSDYFNIPAYIAIIEFSNPLINFIKK
jgi:hypothetical protein